MGLRRTEFGVSSGVNRLFAGSGVKNPPSGEQGTWDQLDQQVWNTWDTAWGDTLATGSNWDAIGTTGWDSWALPWGN